MHRDDRTLLEHAEALAQIGSWDWDVINDVLVWSDNLFRLFGLEPGDVEPSTELVSTRTHPDDRDRLDRLVHVARTTGELEPLGYRIVQPDGEVRHLRSTTSVVAFQDGRPARIVGAVQDLTDRYRADRNVAADLAVADTLAEWDTLDQGAERLVRRLGDALGCAVGTMWVPEGEALVMRSFWHADGLDASVLEELLRALRLERDVGLPGRVWQSGEATSAVRLGEEGRESLRGAVVVLGLAGGLAIPAVHREDVLAVIAFYSKDDLVPDDRLMRSLTGIGYELGMFFDRHRGELAPPGLTPREVEVLQHAAQGLAVKAIAVALAVSPATVRTHFEHIYAKYGVPDRAAAVAEGMRKGLIR